MPDPAAAAGPAPPAGQELRQQLIRRALDTLYVPKRPQTIIPAGADRRIELFDIAARMIGNQPLTYLEFGVHRGASIRQIARRFPNPAAKFVGFDSFEGLPEGWSGLDPGHFSTEGAPPPRRDPRIDFVKGWFQDTLQEYLAANPVAAPVLVNFDADLYSSTLFLMSTLWHHIPEYYFFFDEFIPDEVVAMYDFTRAYPVEFEFFGAIEKNERPIRAMGRIRKAHVQPLPQPAPAAEG